jgi:hypothetical protein
MLKILSIVVRFYGSETWTTKKKGYMQNSVCGNEFFKISQGMYKNGPYKE